MKVVDIELVKIVVDNNRRPVKPAVVKAIADSILAIGLQHPIGVVKQGSKYRLIHGRHRLEAHRALDLAAIPAIVHEMDELHAELAEIDENILRNQLTAADEAKAMARRKEIYEALHPETKHGSGPGRGHTEKKRQDVVSFTEDTAATTGKSRRTVERMVAIGENLDDEAAEIIADTPVARNKSKLAKLAEMEPAKQREVARKVAAGDESELTAKPTHAPCPNCGCLDRNDDGDCQECHDPCENADGQEPAEPNHIGEMKQRIRDAIDWGLGKMPYLKGPALGDILAEVAAEYEE